MISDDDDVVQLSDGDSDESDIQVRTVWNIMLLHHNYVWVYYPLLKKDRCRVDLIGNVTDGEIHLCVTQSIY